MRVKTIGGIAKIFGVGERTAYLWLDKGMPYAVEGSRSNGEGEGRTDWEFDTEDCIRWYAEEHSKGTFKPGRKKSSSGSGDDEDDEIDRETRAAQRDYAVVRAAKAKEEVVWVDLAVQEIESIFGNIRTRIRQLQYDLPGRLVGRTEKEMARVLGLEIDETLNYLANADEIGSIGGPTEAEDWDIYSAEKDASSASQNNDG